MVPANYSLDASWMVLMYTPYTATSLGTKSLRQGSFWLQLHLESGHLAALQVLPGLDATKQSSQGAVSKVLLMGWWAFTLCFSLIDLGVVSGEHAPPSPSVTPFWWLAEQTLHLYLMYFRAYESAACILLPRHLQAWSSFLFLVCRGTVFSTQQQWA